jgi:predicted Zn-dependent peptidase
MSFLHERLHNGLDVVAEIVPGAVSASVGFFVKTGARDESDALSGVSHFLEHMIFKGTADLSADDINRRFDRMGASANAFTGEEETVYHAAVLPEHQDEAVDLLARMMRPALREEDFATEKLVILEEIRMYDDQPPFGADDRCRAAFFGRHPLGRSVLGTVASIEALPVAAMRDYHRRRYAPGTMVLAATGAVDFRRLVDSARRLCGAWEPVAAAPRHAAADARPGASATSERIERPAATLAYAVRMTAAPDGTDPLRYAAKLLAVVMGDESGSRLYWSLVDSGDAEQASCHHHDYLDAGAFITQLACEPDAASPLLERIETLYGEAAAQGISRQEFDRGRNKLASRVVLAGERPRRRLFSVGLEWAREGVYRSVADDLRIVEQISLDDLHEVLHRWPLHGPSATAVAGPTAGDASPATAAASQ